VAAADVCVGAVQILKATLATDAVIGAVTSPRLPGSGSVCPTLACSDPRPVPYKGACAHVHGRYVLLHHVMGEVDGHRGAWAYVEGGMGAVSASLARAALQHGAHIVCDAVKKATAFAW
jgi:phytoene dehydrogenase-like protein